LARLILEIDIGQRVAVVVPDDEAGIVRIIESSMAAGSGAESAARAPRNPRHFPPRADH